MPDSVLLITEDRSIAQKVRDACRELEANLTHLGTLKDAAEMLRAVMDRIDAGTGEELLETTPESNPHDGSESSDKGQ